MFFVAFSHASHKDMLFAKQLLFLCRQLVKNIPRFLTNWHFDDKVGQKYLLESIQAPMVPTYVFYSKAEAIRWAKSVIYPKVFKLRGGAGGSNVKLISSKTMQFV